MAVSDYDYMLYAIKDYYGAYGGGGIWSKIELGTATQEEIMFAFSQIPSRTLSIDRTASGYTLGYGYADPIYMDTYKNPILDSIDSNYETGQYSDLNSFTPRINSTWEYDSVNNAYNVKSGAVSAGSGLTVNTIADRASLAVTGINLGAKLGKLIDEGLYNIDPAWWDEHYPAINPQTWTSIAGESSFGKWFFRTLFDISDDGATAYIDERVLAQTYQMLRDAGYLDSGLHYTGQQVEINHTYTPQFITGTFGELCQKYFNITVNPSDPQYNIDAIIGVGRNGNSILSPNIGSGYMNLPNEITITSVENDIYSLRDMIDSNNVGVWYPDYINNTMHKSGSGSNVPAVVTNKLDFSPNNFFVPFIGNVDLSVSNLPNSTQYPPTNITGTTLDDVLQQLKTNYPDLFSDSIYEDVLQNDGSIDRITYVPIPWASQQTDTQVKPQDQTQPTTSPNAQQDAYVDPQTMTEIFTNPTVPPSDDTTTDVPTTGTGHSPVSPMVTGSGASMWAIYNPTQAQVDAFGSWLWSSNFVDQLKKLFTDPMGAIIGIHKVFATPITGETLTIKCGYIDSQVPSKIVTDQYTSIDCGTVSLSEYFGSVFDYAPYTSVKCFLPFIGIVSLDVADIMRAKINIKYKVDVLTGACIAEIKVKRDGNTSVLYTFSGSCIVSYPISSGSYAGIVSSVLAVAGGAIASGLTGGLPLLGAAMGAGASLMHAHTDTKVNGSFTGSAGAMGGKKPYLIITRPITRVAKYVDKFSGIGANYYMTIGNCEGFFKCNSVHLSISNAYDNELNEIESLLKSGVMMHHEDLEGDYVAPPTTMALNVNQNGIYDAPIGYYGYNPVTVNVLPVLQNKEITANGNYYPDSGYDGLSSVSVNVPQSFSPSDEGKVVSNGQLVAQTARSTEIVVNGTYDTTLNNSVTVNVSGGGTVEPALPNTYQEVQYVTANGSQWIDPDFTLNYYDMMRIKAIRASGSTTGEQDIVGYRDNNVRWDAYFQGSSFYADNNCVITGGSAGNGSCDMLLSVKASTKFSYGSYRYTNRYPFYGNMYTLRIYRPNLSDQKCTINLVAKYVPCYRISDNKVGFYDVVNEKFWTSAGSGNFVAGPNIT